MVKPKTRKSRIFTDDRAGFSWVLPIAAILTFISSWLSIYPSAVIESSYAHTIFPKISHLTGRFADAVPFSWLDVAIPAGGILLVFLLAKRRWALLTNSVAVLYLVFFWGWGLNYHRRPLASKLHLDSGRMQTAGMTEFARRTAAELNRLYVEKQRSVYDVPAARSEAARRVRKVVTALEGTDWQSAQRIKISRIGNLWFHAAGIDGIFNPIGHEPIVSNTILDVEQPFVFSHELAHVRGYPDEGDANLIAAFATLMSDDPAFQYSGWLNLWLYLRTPDLDKLLDPGPSRDVQRIFERARSEQVRWISNFQQVLLDWFLKANSVEEGVRSYSRVVLLAAGTEPEWPRFR